MTSVVPIQKSQQTQESGGGACPSCGAGTVADQRYCLACGQPCSPLRLQFLDVLEADNDERAHTTVIHAPAGYGTLGYAPAPEPDSAIGWLRRYSGLLALVGVLLLTGLIGLLIGHWMKAVAPPGPQVVRIEGAGLPLAAVGTAPTATGATASTPTSATSKAAPLGRAQEEKEVKEAETPTVKAPAPVKTGSASLKKLSRSTGKAHQKEIEALTAGGKPIETGG